MSDITISYKGSSIATMDATGTKTLLTEGKYCEDDITLEYVKPSGGGGTHNLPSGYTEYEYIEATGTQYINTGYVPTADFEIQYIFQRTSSQSYIAAEFGVQPTPKITASGQYFTCGNQSDKNGQGAYNPDAFANTFGPFKYDLHVNIAGAYAPNGTQAVNFGTVTWTSGSLPIFFMARNNNGSAERKAKEKAFYFCATENNVKQVEFIPAMRNSDNELGFYETVSGTFFSNAGTGTFVGGAFT